MNFERLCFKFGSGSELTYEEQDWLLHRVEELQDDLSAALENLNHTTGLLEFHKKRHEEIRASHIGHLEWLDANIDQISKKVEAIQKLKDRADPAVVNYYEGVESGLWLAKTELSSLYE